MKDMQENGNAKTAPVHPIVIERLKEMRTLEENWDSYGALPPEPGAIDRAIVFAREFFGVKPHVSCTNDGKIVFEGDGGNSIEIGGSNGRDEIWVDDDPS